MFHRAWLVFLCVSSAPSAPLNDELQRAPERSRPPVANDYPTTKHSPRDGRSRCLRAAASNIGIAGSSIVGYIQRRLQRVETPGLPVSEEIQQIFPRPWRKGSARVTATVTFSAETDLQRLRRGSTVTLVVPAQYSVSLHPPGPRNP